MGITLALLFSFPAGCKGEGLFVFTIRRNEGKRRDSRNNMIEEKSRGQDNDSVTIKIMIVTA